MFKQNVFVPGIIAKKTSVQCDEQKTKISVEFPLLMNENKSSLAFPLHYRLHKSEITSV